MKKIKIISLLAALLLSATGYAQLKVKSNGKVTVGLESTFWDATSAAPLSIYGSGTDGMEGARISFGKLVKNGSSYSGVFVGQTPASASSGGKSLHLHADHSIVMTVGSLYDNFTLTGSNSSNILMNYHPTPNKLFVQKATQFYSSVIVEGTFTNSSDARLKTNIKKIESPTARLIKLEGLSYLKKNPHLQSEDAEGNKTEGVAPTPEMGFLAQEVEKVFPELVVTDHEGYKSINYIALIPVIVEAMKEQQAVIEAQSKKIAELAGDAGANVLLPGSSQARSLAVQGENETMAADAAANAFLYQNEPNPFSQSTQIRYFLPAEVQSAFIYIFNMQGALIKSLPAGAVGSLTIEASELAPGMYIYSLIADGKEVDSKRMIVTE